MRIIQYKNFSWNTHKKNWKFKRPNVCQFELTFGCDLHCRHCYTDCYNKPVYLRRELNTAQVKNILDKVYNAGCIWVCFTGGDPLLRRDFLDIYAYAKKKGFIIIIFTNACSMTLKIAKSLSQSPPFVIEMTLNAVREDLYEKMSQVKGSFEGAMNGINLILKANLPLKIKTQITKDNLGELPKIRKFVKGLGLKFHPSIDLSPRLNGDLRPCNLRIAPEEVLSLNGNKGFNIEDCRLSPISNLFRCAIGGGDGINIDPYGNMFLCGFIRNPVFNLLKVDTKYAFNKLLPLVRNRRFVSNSKCNSCNLREFCRWCPGKAYLEKGDIEAPIEYYCDLASREIDNE